MTLSKRSIPIAMFIALSSVAVAGPLEDGLTAYRREEYSTALELLRPLANQGLSAAEIALGEMYENGRGVAKDYREAHKWNRKAADHGSADAQFQTGIMYGRGWGVAKDYAEALKWFRKAADQGNANAQFQVGIMYDWGEGVRMDHAEASKWFRKAADYGNANAQFQIGVMYNYGEGVREDQAEAAKWFRKAGDQGNVDAEDALGGSYFLGQGVPQNYAEAAKWYRLAADHGNGFAQYDLAGMYEDGQGAPQDYVQAHMWFNLAAASPDSPKTAIDDAVRGRERVASKMNPAQIAEAQRLAADWLRTAVSGPSPRAATPTSMSVPMRFEGGTFVVPVLINGVVILDFTVDSGAADVSIPADVVMTLIRSRTLSTDTDFLGSQTYVLADGSTIPSQTFRIKTLKVGDRVMENVTGSVAPVAGSLLLGQSFLSRFKSWSIDNQRHELILE